MFVDDNIDDTDNKVLLYDLKSDPEERNNIAAKFPEVVKKMVEM